MTTFIDQYVLPLLANINDPQTQQSLLDLQAISGIQTLDHRLSLKLTLGYPGEAVQQALAKTLGESLSELPGIENVVVDVGWRVPISTGSTEKKSLENVRNVIAVASGKGGVGKSTTTVNLALALSRLGANVGILDADIYGPNQAQMLGAAGRRPEVRDEKTILPVIAHGIQSMSMGYLLTENTPVVWRGPMATGALQQLLFQTQWQDLDYLFVDMPPGTGDIQLT
ncbi:MAG: ATP-binding protein involved in chromosome partitioning, partial [Cellvibrionaceae bacterium]